MEYSDSLKKNCIIKRFNQAKKGAAFFIVLSVVSVMAVFVLFYFSFSRHFSASNFYHINRDKLTDISNIILDSAFANIQSKTKYGQSTLAKKLVDQMKPMHSLGAKIPLKAPLFEKEKSELLGGLDVDYSVTASVFDKRTKDDLGYSYYPGEGQGTLALELTAALKTSSGHVLAACKKIRHYDFRSACLVSCYKKRKNYAMTYPLDYAILVRDALRQYDELPNGLNWNCGTRLILSDESSINPINKRGWVYLGGANENSNRHRVALNISNAPECANLLPKLSTKRYSVDQTECFKIVPEIKAQFDKKKVKISGVKGFFKVKVVPAAKANLTSYTDREKEAKSALEIGPDSKPYLTSGSIINFAGPKTDAYFNSIFKGAITERFLYLVQFVTDYSQMVAKVKGKVVPIPTQDILKLTNASTFVSVPPDCNFIKYTSAGAKKLKYMNRIKDLVQRKNPPISLFSEYKKDLLYKPGQSVGKIPPDKSKIFGKVPDFYSFSGARLSSVSQPGDGGMPLHFIPLRTSRFENTSDLEKYGFYDRANGILNLRGVIEIKYPNKKPLTFSAPKSGGPIIVKGQGAIMCNRGFNIYAGIKLNDATKDMCVLFASGGNINISTTQKISAALMAFNNSNSGTIIAQKPLNIMGSIGVDRIYGNSFPKAVSKLTYDSRFKALTSSDEIFTLTISPWIRFAHTKYGKGIKIGQ